MMRETVVRILNGGFDLPVFVDMYGIEVPLKQIYIGTDRVMLKPDIESYLRQVLLAADREETAPEDQPQQERPQHEPGE